MNSKKTLVFVTVGTHSQPFNRLLQKMDELVKKKVVNNVFAQTGYSDYKPKHYAFQNFLGLNAFQQKMDEATIIVTHGGEGNIGQALQRKKKCVIVPRLKKFGEHTNDHQLELTRAIVNKKAAIAVLDMNELENAIKKIRARPPASLDGGKKIVGLLNAFIKEAKLL